MSAKVHAKFPGEKKPPCGQSGKTTNAQNQVTCWRCLGVLLGVGA